MRGGDGEVEDVMKSGWISQSSTANDRGNSLARRTLVWICCNNNLVEADAQNLLLAASIAA